MNKNIYYQGEHDTHKHLLAFYDKLNNNSHTLPHFHRSVEIIYFLKGSAKVTIDGETFTVNADDIMFAKRCSTHEIIYDESKTLLLIIPPKYSNDFEFIFQKTTIPSHLNDKEFNQTLKQYFSHLCNQTETSDMVIKGYVNIIIGKLYEHYPNTEIENSANVDLIIHVLNYVDKHYGENISLESISNHFGYNKYYFSRLFNSTVGENLTSYINGVRLRNLFLKARKIEKPNFSELILDYGFESFSTFYRACYQKYNLSPKEILYIDHL